MSPNSLDSPGTPHSPPLSIRDAAILAVALSLPTLVTWLYFVALSEQPAAVQQGAYAVGKTIQFALPAVWVLLVLKERPRLVWPGWPGLLMGLAFGLAVMGLMAAVYYLVLKPQGLFDQPAEEVRAKVKSFGVATLASYLVLAVFYSLVHSLLEEYYWRWFVFGYCCRPLPPSAAVAISSIGFAAHHVLVLAKYFGYGSPLTWLFTLGIVIGGAFWAWLYRRSGSLAGPWLSHALVVATIFLIGWDLIRP
jgi:membrane protease YdiL (CAAX protease family)